MTLRDCKFYTGAVRGATPAWQMMSMSRGHKFSNKWWATFCPQQIQDSINVDYVHFWQPSKNWCSYAAKDHVCFGGNNSCLNFFFISVQSHKFLYCQNQQKSIRLDTAERGLHPNTCMWWPFPNRLYKMGNKSPRSHNFTKIKPKYCLYKSCCVALVMSFGVFIRMWTNIIEVALIQLAHSIGSTHQLSVIMSHPFY